MGKPLAFMEAPSPWAWWERRSYMAVTARDRKACPDLSVTGPREVTEQRCGKCSRDIVAGSVVWIPLSYPVVFCAPCIERTGKHEKQGEPGVFVIGRKEWIKAVQGVVVGEPVTANVEELAFSAT